MTADPFVILYVEDNDCIREAFTMMLAAAGRQVVSVADGMSAREALRKQNVDLLITDINLPDGSGVDVAREALRQNPTLPIILCSGHHSKDVAQSLGPTAHSLTKPIEPYEFEALVDRLARRGT